MKLILPMPPNAANARRHWRVALKEKKAYWQKCDLYLASRQMEKPPTEPFERVRMQVTMYLGNYMDDDNAMARLKPMQDWLKAHGYIADDRRRNIEWAGMPEQKIDRKAPRVEVWLIPIITENAA